MNYSQIEADVIAADGLEELNYRQKRLLLAVSNPDNPDRDKYLGELIKTLGESVYNKICDKFRDGKYREKLFKVLNDSGIECVTLKTNDYPFALKQISQPPLVLYARGRRELLAERKVSVVGSRRTAVTVLEECRRICAELSEYLAVATGIADGADHSAALGAMEHDKAICVLPGGHDVSCPSDGNFAKKLIDHGLVLSQFPPKTKIRSYTFSMRNAVLAGLSEATVVVSADMDGGALSTAAYAADFSRDVLAFPYNIGVPSGRGCNRLIKTGAYMCESAQDVLEVMHIDVEKRTAEKAEPDGDGAVIVNLLREKGEMHVNDVAAFVSKPLPEVLTVLSMLEIMGLVLKTGINTFTAV